MVINNNIQNAQLLYIIILDNSYQKQYYSYFGFGKSDNGPPLNGEKSILMTNHKCAPKKVGLNG